MDQVVRRLHVFQSGREGGGIEHVALHDLRGGAHTAAEDLWSPG